MIAVTNKDDLVYNYMCVYVELIEKEDASKEEARKMSRKAVQNQAIK